MIKAKILLASLASVLALTGCASTDRSGADGNYVTPIGNSPVTPNPTPYSEALVCLANYARTHNLRSPRVAVGRLSDYTGRASLEGGAAITQGASLMAISAFSKAGIRLVERFDTSISELELRYANNSLIGNSDGTQRQIRAASLPGSDYNLVGGITELNYNIRSSGVDVMAGDRIDSDPTGLFSRRMWVMNIGLDLRLNETQTMETVDVISYQKQIIGREISAGVFAFWGDAVVDISAGGRSLEPVQLAVRTVIERAVLEISAQLYGVDPSAACAYSDPIGGGVSSGPTNTTGGVNIATAYGSRETSNVQMRQSVDHGHERRDDSVRTYLRGRYD
ncbi:holdfast anchoring protein HfaB [uncultured Maricaulis sp.]|uniref:holdfast anchoring protein HfaB n=1 Tax=uncultured Maricaulis sp. TaxID=174710 RepID=UPI0030D94260|tara:strand:+ start:5008 stop:6015 length:1008 start_codon:yes stop_codon:yes gene_type:complete